MFLDAEKTDTVVRNLANVHIASFSNSLSISAMRTPEGQVVPVITVTDDTNNYKLPIAVMLDPEIFQGEREDWVLQEVKVEESGDLKERYKESYDKIMEKMDKEIEANQSLSDDEILE